MDPMPLSFETLIAYLNRFWSINSKCPVVVAKIMPKPYLGYIKSHPMPKSAMFWPFNWSRWSDGKVLYNNAFVTHHVLDEQRVPLVVAAGRCRWKTENESHNVLKTKGYHLEHNFGHGQKHLSATLLTLNLLAFLFHIVLQMVDIDYQKIRQQRSTYEGFFQDILSLTKYLLFEGWQALIEFMLADLSPKQRANSS